MILTLYYLFLFSGLEVSARHPYLFSCGEDRQVKCWDLEYNKVSMKFVIFIPLHTHSETEPFFIFYPFSGCFCFIKRKRL